MRTSTALVVAAAALSSATLAVSPARADIFWVANGGSDAAACTFAAPCLTFQHVHDANIAGSEVRCKESGNYGGLNPISKSFTVNCEDNIASTNVGFTVTTGASDTVVVRGVELNGFRVSYGCCGSAFTFNGGGVLVLHKVTIAGYQGSAGGLEFKPNAAARLIVLDSKIYDNGS